MKIRIRSKMRKVGDVVRLRLLLFIDITLIFFFFFFLRLKNLNYKRLSKMKKGRFIEYDESDKFVVKHNIFIFFLPFWLLFYFY